ncbi:hypothetical protein OOK13_00340 [Streptomyces sp. NBC_00378]|uniref:hypothetical protein n=1 Tax=unclassified Streptomyces TaxID=2593676 RepID=UPI002255DBDD|nr:MULTISPECIES: hypothetical protein [unclassified Streptomyces]MCX5107053.1 hypothetical protein [Streptomyces sp. NBC_00378]
MPPRFGDTDVWDFNGVVRKAPNGASANMRAHFRGLPPQWNLLGRELAMIWFNPRHPAVLARGLHLPAKLHSPVTVGQRVGHLRALAAFGRDHQLPETLASWAEDDFRHYVSLRCQSGESASALAHVFLIKTLHRFRRCLASGGLNRDPWPGQTCVLDICSRRVLGYSMASHMRAELVIDALPEREI